MLQKKDKVSEGGINSNVTPLFSNVNVEHGDGKNLPYVCDSTAAIDISWIDNGHDEFSDLTISNVSGWDIDSRVTSDNASTVIDHIVDLILSGDKNIETQFVEAGHRDVLYRINQGKVLNKLAPLVEEYMPDITPEEFFHTHLNGVFGKGGSIRRYRMTAAVPKVECWAKLGWFRLEYLASKVNKEPFATCGDPVGEFIYKYDLFNNVRYLDLEQEKNGFNKINRAVFFEQLESKGVDLELLDRDMVMNIAALVDNREDPFRNKYAVDIAKGIKTAIDEGNNPNDFLGDVYMDVGVIPSDKKIKVRAPDSLRRKSLLLMKGLKRYESDPKAMRSLDDNIIDQLVESLNNHKKINFDLNRS